MPYKKKIITCQNCGKNHLASKPSVKYCSTGCYNIATKTKKPDGYRLCLWCNSLFPYRNSLKVRSCNGVQKKTGKFCSFKCSLYYKNKNQNPSKTQEAREKIRKAAKARGVKHLHTPEATAKRRKTIQGRGHWNWQGGKTPVNKKRRNSLPLKIWRFVIFERDGYTCTLCGSKGGELQADHIEPWSTAPEKRLLIENGRTLCKGCHQKTPTYGGRTCVYGDS